jgi:GT2 family glycosyltransferase
MPATGTIPKTSTVGAVVIGRNEGERLERCLASLVDRVGRIVYVDSGSTDGSVDAARAAGADVVELDDERPFTAARARNAGAARLCELEPGHQFVQFVDGDCEMDAEWVDAGLAVMARSPRLAVVCGRRRERAPEASVYNRLCDMEWDTPVGPAEACGGDALMRRAAFEQCDGFREDLIAGEEPELCVRLRRSGWTIERLDREMTLHDARMERFGQWWRRAVRAGHAYVEGRRLHGRSGQRHGVREVRSIVLWGGALPLAAVVLAWPTRGASLGILLALYGVQWWRIRRHRLRTGDSPAHAGLYARYCVLGKVPEMLGVLTYWINRLRRRRTGLIEYK